MSQRMVSEDVLSSASSDFGGVDSDNDDDLFVYSHEDGWASSGEADDLDPIYGTCNILDHNSEEGPAFRVLRIRNGPPDSEIHCDLVKRPIYEANLSYSALSYSWGTASASEKIHIGLVSHSFMTTKHLYAALCRLRSETRPVYIWVDAICINQENLDEKEAQIPLIAQIFNQASEVLIWLAEASLLHGDVFHSLCYRPNAWWTRLWVLQETLYAEKEPIVLLGPHRLTMSDFLQQWKTAMESLNTRQVSERHYSFLSDAARQASYLRILKEGYEQMNELRDAWRAQFDQGDFRRPIAELARFTAKRHCGQPLDRLYALLNIAVEREARHFRADYRKDPEQLRTEVIHYHLNNTKWTLRTLEQLQQDLFRTRREGSDPLLIQHPHAVSHQLLACPRNLERASKHVYYDVSSDPFAMKVALTPAWSDGVAHILTSRTAEQLQHDISVRALAGYESAIKQALSVYFSAAQEASIAAPPQQQQDLSTWHALLPSIQSVSSDGWASFLEDDGQAFDFGSIIVTHNGIIGVQLPFNAGKVHTRDALCFPDEGGLGYVVRQETGYIGPDWTLEAQCFVPRTHTLHSFIASRGPESRSVIDVQLPASARICARPFEVFL